MQDSKRIKACVFDAYGTLFDVHSAVGKHRERIGASADALSATWRVKQLEYTWLRSLMGRYEDFWRVTSDALDYALAAHQVSDDGLHDALMQAYLSLNCYAEVPDVLAQLKQQGFKTAILSNGSPAMLDSAVRNSNLEPVFDQVLSVHDLGIYKPTPAVYQLACDALGLAAAEISFQSSNAWDATGARCFGFQVAWINRFGQQEERLGCPVDHELKNLSGLQATLS